MSSYMERAAIEAIRKAEEEDDYTEYNELMENPDNWDMLDWMMRGEESIEERNR